MVFVNVHDMSKALDEEEGEKDKDAVTLSIEENALLQFVQPE